MVRGGGGSGTGGELVDEVVELLEPSLVEAGEAAAAHCWDFWVVVGFFRWMENWVERGFEGFFWGLVLMPIWMCVWGVRFCYW